MSVLNEVRDELKKLSRQYSSLAELCRDPLKLPLFVAEYQRWYTRALGFVSLLGQDRLEEFRGYYLADPRRRVLDGSTYSIQDYLLALRPESHVKLDVHRAVLARLTAQMSILQSLDTRLEDVLTDVEGRILAELEDAEIEAARELLKISPRAAGALAAVVLKAHLLKVAKHHGVKVLSKKPSVPYLNDLLKRSRVYDMSNWRNIQLLHNLQKTCVKSSEEEPEAGEVEDLISRVDSVVKTVV